MCVHIYIYIYKYQYILFHFELTTESSRLRAIYKELLVLLNIRYKYDIEKIGVYTL